MSEVVKQKRQKVHVDINIVVLAKLDVIAEDVDLSRSDIIRIALHEYVNRK